MFSRKCLSLSAPDHRRRHEYGREQALMNERLSHETGHSNLAMFLLLSSRRAGGYACSKFGSSCCPMPCALSSFTGLGHFRVDHFTPKALNRPK